MTNPPSRGEALFGLAPQSMQFLAGNARLTD
jgi:hypothetical protein